MSKVYPLLFRKPLNPPCKFPLTAQEVLLIVCPQVILTFISWVSFWLYSEATSDRISLGRWFQIIWNLTVVITTVLTMTFMGVEAWNTTPKWPTLLLLTILSSHLSQMWFRWLDQKLGLFCLLVFEYFIIWSGSSFHTTWIRGILLGGIRKWSLSKIWKREEWRAEATEEKTILCVIV